jgi:hypothetical protein
MKFIIFFYALLSVIFADETIEVEDTEVGVDHSGEHEDILEF